MSLTKIEIYESYRLKVLGENELVHQRMSWFIPLQSFLFISFALFSNGSAFEGARFFVFWGFAIVGCVSALATFVSVQCAFAAIHHTVDRWKTEVLPDEALDKLPALTRGKPGARTAGYGKIFAVVFPLCVAAFWVLIAVLVVWPL